MFEQLLIMHIFYFSNIFNVCFIQYSRYISTLQFRCFIIHIKSTVFNMNMYINDVFQRGGVS